MLIFKTGRSYPEKTMHVVDERVDRLEELVMKIADTTMDLVNYGNVAKS